MDDTPSERSLRDLLCGIREDERMMTACKRNVFLMQVVTLDNILTAPWRCYCDRNDDHLSLAYLLHVSCQWVFKQALKTSPRAAVTAGKILEYAYLWALAGRSCKFSLLDFDSLVARFQCEDIQPGYIFQKNSNSLDSAKVAEMQKGTLYYGWGNTPCADIFFKDDIGALHLVDVGGSSNMSKALNKVHKMNDVLVKEGSREDLQVSEFQGAALLPNIVNIRRKTKKSQQPSL